VPSERLEGVALVTGGGRGIGADVARELAAAGMQVAVTARTADEVEAVASEIGGQALVGDVSKREDVERLVREVGRSTSSSRTPGATRRSSAHGSSIPTSGGTSSR